MGYTTDFAGVFRTDKPLTAAHRAYLQAFNETRRMRRDAALTALRPDPVREAAGLPVGEEGGYFVGAAGFCGQETEPKNERFAHESSPVGLDVIDSNNPPAGQPGLWCQWVPDDSDSDSDGDPDPCVIKHDGGEKFYDYVEWLEYLIAHFLKPWGYTLNGVVRWEGDRNADRGAIVAEGNAVRAVREKPSRLPKETL